MEYLIIALIVLYCPWLVPVAFVILLFVWLYFSYEPLFWFLIVAFIVLCICACFYSGKRY